MMVCKTAAMSLQHQPCPCLQSHVPGRHKFSCHSICLNGHIHIAFLCLAWTTICNREQCWKRLCEKPRIRGISKLLTPGHNNIGLGGTMCMLMMLHLSRPRPGTSHSSATEPILPKSFADILQLLRICNIWPCIKGEHPRRADLMNRLRGTVRLLRVPLLTIFTTLLLLCLITLLL
jgi:hypothetical protein